MNQEKLGLYFIGGWFLVTLGWMIPSLITDFQYYPPLLRLDLEEKKRLLEGELYKVAKACEREIPPMESLFFYNPQPAGNSLSRAHDRQKISYFLYPRRVYWEKERVKEPIRYILIYRAQLELPGFVHLVDITDDIYLLKRDEK